MCLPPFVLVPFPKKDVERRNEWIKRVNRKGWQPNVDSRICSSHFVGFDLLERKPCPMFPYPTLSMGYDLTPEQVKVKRKPPKDRNSSPPIKKSKCVNLTEMICSSDQDVGINVTVTTTLPNESQENGNEHLHVDEETLSSQNISGCPNCEKYERKIKKLQSELYHWQRLYMQKQQKPFGLEILENDKKVKCYTGLESKEVFDGIFGSFGDKVKKIRHWKGPSKTVAIAKPKRKGKNGPKRFLTAKEEYFMTLFCTRTMLKAEVIGDLFGVSATVVSRTCLTWWKFMASELKALVYNPSKEACKALLPKSFNTPKYMNVNHIADCTEIFTETQKCSSCSVVKL